MSGFQSWEGVLGHHGVGKEECVGGGWGGSGEAELFSRQPIRLVFVYF